MKYPADRVSSSEFSKIVDLSAIVSITAIILFIIQAATHSEISSDIQQSLFAILVILILAAINIFGNIINKDSIRDNQIAESIINVYGGGYQNNSQTTFELQTPANYFDVLKTIEQIPVDIDQPNPGMQDVMLELQSYILTEPNLSVERRQTAMGKIQEIAVEAIEHPDNLALKKFVDAIRKIEGNQKLRSTLIKCLISITDEYESAFTLISRVIDSLGKVMY